MRLPFAARARLAARARPHQRLSKANRTIETETQNDHHDPKRGAQLAGALFWPLSIPVIASPLFIVSGPELVIAQCKAGIVGSFPSLNARPVSHAGRMAGADHRGAGRVRPRRIPKRRRRRSPSTRSCTRSNDRLEQDVELCVKYKVPIVITSLGAREDVNDAVHSYGGVVLHDIINNRFARKAIEKGADGLIPVAAGAGGHAGALSPFALVAGDPRMVRRPDRAVGRHRQRRARCWPRRRWARISPISARPSSPPQEANAPQGYKQMIVEQQRRGHRLHQPVHRRARQLSAPSHRRAPASTRTTCRKPIRRR